MKSKRWSRGSENQRIYKVYHRWLDSARRIKLFKWHGTMARRRIQDALQYAEWGSAHSVQACNDCIDDAQMHLRYMHMLLVGSDYVQ